MSKKLLNLVFIASLLFSFPALAAEKTTPTQAEKPSIDAKQIEQWRETGIHYFTGEHRLIRKNYETAREFFEKAGAKGDATSLYYLGTMYDNGLGVAVNEDKAQLFYQRAAELGHADSQMLTGVLLIIKGIAESNEERQQKIFKTAVNWLEKAVKQGNMEAAFWLGDMLRKGLGAEKDEKRGVALLRTSAESNNPNALAMLGALYWQGQSGIEKDLMKAHALISKSIRYKNEQAANLLIYVENDMTEEQRKTAKELAQKAAAAEEKSQH